MTEFGPRGSALMLAHRTQSAVAASRSGPVISQTARPTIETPNQVLIEVRMAGLCRTDLYASRCGLGCPPGRILGHEFAGTVAQVGRDVTHVTEGQRVTVMPYLTCRRCADCHLTQGRLCEAPSFLGVDRDGAFAESIVVPGHSVFPLPPNLDWRQGAYVEPIAACLAVMNVVEIDDGPGLLFGHGRIAELTHRVLTAHGIEVDTCRHLSELPAGGRYAYVIETSAASDGIGELLHAVRPGGRVILKSRPAEHIPFDLGLAVRREVSLHGVHYGDFGAAIALLSGDRLVVDDLLGEVYPLAAFEAAFAQDDGLRKTFLTPTPEHAR